MTNDQVTCRTAGSFGGVRSPYAHSVSRARNRTEEQFMSYLSDYDHRTAWKYEPIRGTFHTAPGLALKATPEGAYVPFRGTTVVFRMNRQDQHIIRLMQDILYHHLNADSRQPILMPVLREETFHLTLHDLVCPTLCVSDLRDEAGYRHELSDSLVRAGRITEAIRRDFAGRSVTLVADRIVNMVSTSLVLLLRPASEEDFDLLMDVYRRFDDIVPPRRTVCLQVLVCQEWSQRG